MNDNIATPNESDNIMILTV